MHLDPQLQLEFVQEIHVLYPTTFSADKIIHCHSPRGISNLEKRLQENPSDLGDHRRPDRTRSQPVKGHHLAVLLLGTFAALYIRRGGGEFEQDRFQIRDEGVGVGQDLLKRERVDVSGLATDIDKKTKAGGTHRAGDVKGRGTLESVQMPVF